VNENFSHLPILIAAIVQMKKMVELMETSKCRFFPWQMLNPPQHSKNWI